MTVPSFWEFAFETYERSGIAADLIALQDDHRADVNMILFCLWLAAQRRDVGPLLTAALEISDTWSDAIAHLRECRRKLKALIAGAKDSPFMAVRERIKACEMEAERVQITVLGALATEGGQPTVADSPSACARRNLAQYFSALDLPADLLGRDGILRILETVRAT
jgi:uncharacterized protein (TIGR02444 family)